MNCVYVFTGAGTSAEAGIPTFRFDSDGKPAFWNNIDPMQVADIATFRKNREESCSFHNSFRTLIGESEPTLFHTEIKRWQDDYSKRGIALKVITQNVDDLFEKAGVKDVSHVHGDIRYMQCLAYNHQWFVGYAKQDVEQPCGRGCGCCVCKPGVVFFNERAPMYEPTLKELEQMDRRDLFIVIGTSCQVFPLDSILRNGRVHKVYSGLEFPTDAPRDLYDDVVLGPCTETILTLRKLADEVDKRLRDSPPPDIVHRRKKKSSKKRHEVM